MHFHHENTLRDLPIPVKTPGILAFLLDPRLENPEVSAGGTIRPLPPPGFRPQRSITDESNPEVRFRSRSGARWDIRFWSSIPPRVGPVALRWVNFYKQGGGCSFAPDDVSPMTFLAMDGNFSGRGVHATPPVARYLLNAGEGASHQIGCACDRANVIDSDTRLEDARS